MSLHRNDLLKQRPAPLDQRYQSLFLRLKWNTLRQCHVSRSRKKHLNRLSRSKRPASQKKSTQWKPNPLKSRQRRRPQKRHPKKQLRMPKKNQKSLVEARILSILEQTQLAFVSVSGTHSTSHKQAAQTRISFILRTRNQRLRQRWNQFYHPRPHRFFPNSGYKLSSYVEVASKLPLRYYVACNTILTISSLQLQRNVHFGKTQYNVTLLDHSARSHGSLIRLLWESTRKRKKFDKILWGLSPDYQPKATKKRSPVRCLRAIIFADQAGGMQETGNEGTYEENGRRQERANGHRSLPA